MTPILPQRFQVARRATLVSAMINSALALFKVIIGMVAHSHALVADGLHSFSDLLTDALVYVAAKAGMHLPDEDHPYGHQRIETIATIVISLILVGVGTAIAYDTIHHFFNQRTVRMIGLPVLIVAILSIIANEWLYRYTFKLGKQVHSNLLIANALHNRSDAWVSGLVVVGVLGSFFGFVYLDLIVALFIAILILKMGFKMMWEGLRELVDTGVDVKTLHEITQIIKHVLGVLSVHELRTRYHGGNIFVDVHILVDSYISVSEGHYIGERVRSQLMEQLKAISDVVVHVDPEDDRTAASVEHLPHRKEIEALLRERWHNLPGFNAIQRLSFHYLNGQLQVEIFMSDDAVQMKSYAALIADYRDAIKNMNEIGSVTIYFSGRSP